MVRTQGGGGTLIFSYIRRLGFKILNFNIFFFGGGGGVQKNEYFFGKKILLIFFWGLHKTGLYLGVIPMYFILYMVFS